MITPLYFLGLSYMVVSLWILIDARRGDVLRSEILEGCFYALLGAYVILIAVGPRTPVAMWVFGGLTVLVLGLAIARAWTRIQRRTRARSGQ
jgi:hypothetical protein